MNRFTQHHLQFYTKIFVGVMIAGGIVGLYSLPWEKQKVRPSTILQVVATCPNQIAMSMQTAVTTPIETAIQRAPLVTSFSSTTTDSVSTIQIDLSQSRLPLSAAKLHIISAIQSIEFLTKQKVSLQFEDLQHETTAILQLFLSSPNLSLTTISALAKNLSTKIFQLVEIQKIDIRGLADEQIQLKVDPQKLRKYGISFPSFIKQLQQYRQLDPTEILHQRNHEFSIPVVMGIAPISINNIDAIFIHGGQETVSLEKLLLDTPQRILSPHRSKIRVNQQDGIQLIIHKKPSAPTLQTATSIEKVCTLFSKEIQSVDSSITTWKNSAVEIKNMVVSSYAILFFGSLTASIMIGFFWGTTIALWSIGGLVLSLSMTVCVIQLVDSALYFSTLYGALLSSGLVLYTCALTTKKVQHHETGFSIKNNIFFHLTIFGTLITGLIPLYFFIDTTHWIQEIPIYLLIFLGANFFTCCFFIPTLLLGKTIDHPPAELRLIRIINFIHEQIKRLCLHTKKSSIGLFSCVLLLAFLLESSQPYSTETPLSLLQITGEFYGHSSVLETQILLVPIETFLQSFVESGSANFFITLQSIGNRSHFQITCQFSDNFFKKISTKQLMEKIKNQCSLLPMVRTISISSMHTTSTQWGTNSTSIEVVGDDVGLRNRAVWDVVQYLRDVRDIDHIFRSDESISELIFVEPTVSKIFPTGISVETLQEKLQGQLRVSSPLKKIFVDETHTLIDATISLENLNELLPRTIATIEIPTTQGSIPLQNLAKIYKKKYPNTLIRNNGKDTTSIQVNFSQELASPTKIDRKLNKILKNCSNQYQGINFLIQKKVEIFPKFVIVISILGMLFLLSQVTILQPIVITCILWGPFFISLGVVTCSQDRMHHIFGVLYAWILFTGLTLISIFLSNAESLHQRKNSHLPKNVVRMSEAFLIPFIMGSFLLPGLLPIASRATLFIFDASILRIFVTSLFIPIFGSYLFEMLQQPHNIATDNR